MFLTEILISLSEPFYKEFQSKLMPGVPNDSVLGVRTPLIRGIAKKYYGSREATEFILNLPHVYYEENNLHAFIIEQIKDFTSVQLFLLPLNTFTSKSFLDTQII